MHNLEAFETGRKKLHGGCKARQETFSFERLFHDLNRLSKVRQIFSELFFEKTLIITVLTTNEIVNNCRFLETKDLTCNAVRVRGINEGRRDESSFTIGLVRFVDTKMSIARRLNLCKHASRSCSWISGIDGGTLGQREFRKWTVKSILAVDIQRG